MKISRILILFIILNLIISIPIQANEVKMDFPTGHIEENITEVYDENNQYIFSTGMGVTRGDRYISQNNVEYVIEKVTENKAIAKKLGKIELLSNTEKVVDAFYTAEGKNSKTIALYHTHNGESYQPGAENVEGRGDIHTVGKAFKQALEKYGINVIHSENMHLPHDGAAYERSRATAVELSSKRPDAIFDLHRDAIPRREEYLTRLNGKTISQIRIVVGRQNPNRKANDQFARTLKSISDDLYPGLIRDIFYGGGSYNQQLSTHSLLLEFGTHVTGKNRAVDSTKMMASTINQLLYGQGQGMARESERRERSSTIKTLLWIILLSMGGLFAYLYVSEGSLEGVIKRLRKYFKQEIIDRGKK